jgi:hypothetical protein
MSAAWAKERRRIPQDDRVGLILSGHDKRFGALGGVRMPRMAVGSRALLAQRSVAGARSRSVPAALDSATRSSRRHDLAAA